MKACPTFILVRPQLPENLGAVARVMMNFGLEDLRLVAPLMDPLDPKAVATSTGAESILKSAHIFPDLSEAIADLTDVYGTGAHQRDMIKVFHPPREAMPQIRAEISAHRSVGIVFGPERTGLHNDEMALMKSILQVPVNPDFSSLNLAQAAAIVAYEWHHPEDKIGGLRCGETSPAPQAQLTYFLAELETILDSKQFWRVPSKKPVMWRNLKNVFTRSELTEQELRTLLGLVRSLGDH